MKTKQEIELLAEQYIEDNTGDYYVYCGYIEGYTQCQKDNKDKKYTEEDIIKAIKLARETESIRRGALSGDWDDVEKYDEMDIIYLLNKQD